MSTSLYFEQALFYAQSPATDQFFEESSDVLFQIDDKKSHIDIQDHYLHEAPNGSRLLANKGKADPSLGDECSSIPPSQLDQSRYQDHEPPQYVQSPGLRHQVARECEDLKKIAEVWILYGCISYTANIIPA